MTREDELASSREPLRDSVDSYGSASDIDLDMLDELEEEPRLRLKGRRSKRASAASRDELYGIKSRRKGGCCRTKKCAIISAILISGLVILLASLAWMFKTHRPLDGQSPPWYPAPLGGTVSSWADSYKKAAAMVGKMTLPEKVNITTGTGWATNLCVGNSAPAVNVGFPMLCLQDGPLGIRFADHATAWPAGITVAATWNRDLMYRRGKALGLEHRLKGVNVMLGPSMGPLGRMPAGGRNWEGFGPDPVLAGVSAAQTIKGIQDEGVMATAKHMVANEQEHFRQAWEWGTPSAISSNIDDRTMHELYMWPFADSVRAGVASVMCSYNMVNNSYACGNSKLMNGILKDELGFQGFVQSDWLAQRSGVASALAGLDMSMPGDGAGWNDRKSYWGPKLTEAALNGSVPMTRLDDMATRIVASWYQLKQDDESVWPKPAPDGDGGPNFSSFTDEEIGKLHDDTGDESTGVVNKFVDVQGTGDDFHGWLAQEVAAEGTVLVKNEAGILPLSIQGWADTNKPDNDVKYKVGIFGEDARENPDGPNACEDRACNVGTLASGWGSGAVLFPFLTTPFKALQSTFDHKKVEVTAMLDNDIPKNETSTIREQDLCLVFVNSDAGEGFKSWNHVTDRPDLFPQKGGDALVKRIADNCKNSVVIVHAVGPVVLERWIDHPNVKAVLLANLPGEESGNALTDVLFGIVDASGRLPYTVGKSLSDYGDGGQIMYKPNGLAPQQDFTEGLLIDYRHFDAMNITPRYEFGFGLSYTTFAFSSLRLQELKPKSPLPSPRPTADAKPPTFPTAIPDASEAVWPADFRKIDRYIYPYRDNSTISKGAYPYPKGYFTTQQPSQAGGGEGGNPSLYDEHLSVSVHVTNVGDRKGKHVVQVYLSFPPTTDASTGQKIAFPVRVLRGFQKLEIDKGMEKNVEVHLTRRDLSYWSVGRQNWVMPDGEFKIWVGASSRDLPLSAVW